MLENIIVFIGGIVVGYFCGQQIVPRRSGYNPPPKEKWPRPTPSPRPWIIPIAFALVFFGGEAMAQSNRQPVRYRNAGSMWDRQTEPNRFWPKRWTSGKRSRRVPRLRTARKLSRRKRSNGVPLLRSHSRRQKGKARTKKRP